jgi:large subunit ribosomal protein L23
MNLYQVLKKPMITEKALNQSVLGKYLFVVDKRATKTEIKKAVKKAFAVDTISVKIINLKGKTRRVGRRRRPVQLASWKKAIVQLAPGQKIDVFTVPGEVEESTRSKKPVSAKATKVEKEAKEK